MLRDATAADVAAITAIYAIEVREHVNTYEYDVPDEAEMARRMDAIVGAGYPYIVAQEPDGTIGGYAYASSYRARLGYRMTVENSVYVADAAHGRGIGTALMQALIAECEARGFRQMVAVIGGAHPASIAVHAAAGFEHSGRMTATGFKHGRWLDTVFMQRPLGEGAETEPATAEFPGTIA